MELWGDHSDVDSDSEWVREVSANGISMKTTEVEAKLDQGNIQEAEASLREGLSLNFEEARSLLGKLEYQRGNVEGALRVFEGIDLQAAIQRLQPSLAEKPSSRRGRFRTESLHAVSQHAASLVLEAIYLKAKSLQKLGRVSGILLANMLNRLRNFILIWLYRSGNVIDWIFAHNACN